MIRFVLLVAVSICHANAGDDSRYLRHVDELGAVVTVLELRQPCPLVVVNEPNGGCALPQEIRVIFTPARNFDPAATAHELDHIAGLRHGPWEQRGNGDKCAVIFWGGRTQWTAGNFLCRSQSRGHTYQVAP